MARSVATANPTETERPLAAVAYLFTFLTGLVVLSIAGREQRYARWNAIQAIGLGVAGMAFGFIGSILSAIVFASSYLDGRGPPWYLAWGGLGAFGAAVAVAVLVLVAVGAIQAYRGRPIRLPVIAQIADRLA